MNTQRLEFLARVASLYYEDGLEQSEIAGRINRSRSMVSRLLQEARDAGLVEIRVRHPLKTESSLETRLVNTFGLTQSCILATPSADYEAMLARLGKLGAQVLRQRLDAGIRLGVGWGTAVYEVVQALSPLALPDSVVIQIIGALGHGDPMIDGPELARWLAQKLNTGYRFLHAPLIVEDEAIAQSLRRQRSIAETLSQAGAVDIALVGIGTVATEHSSLRRAGYLTESQLADLEEYGAVGDIVARQLDIHGNALDIPLNRRVIGIDLETLRTIPMVISVAGGTAKASAILAALRGGYVDVLITDSETAKLVLALNEDEHYAG